MVCEVCAHEFTQQYALRLSTQSKSQESQTESQELVIAKAPFLCVYFLSNIKPFNRFMGGGIPDPGIRFQIFEPGRLNGSKYQLYDNIKWSHDITCSVDSTEKTVKNREEFEDFRSDHFEFRNGIMIILILHYYRVTEGIDNKKYLLTELFIIYAFPYGSRRTERYL